MPLPPEIVAARERMQAAQDELLAYVESEGPHEIRTHNALLEKLNRATQEFLDTIAGLRPN